MASWILILTATALGSVPAANVPLPVSLELEPMMAVPVQHDGRWPPLDTVAHDLVKTITGQETVQGQDPLLLLLAWTFDPGTWADQPLIRIGNAELRAELGLPAGQTVFSYNELVTHDPLVAQIRALANLERGRKPNPLESKVSDLNEKLLKLQGVFDNQAIRMIPDGRDPLGAWRPVPFADQAERTDAVSAAWTAAREAFLANDAPAFSSASARLKAALAELPAAHRPAPELLATELRYNHLRPFRAAWQVMLAGAVLAAAAMLVRRRWFDALAILGMLAGFGLLTYGLSLRLQIAGRIPAANMFESLLFLSWGMGAFAIVAMLAIRSRVVPLTASAMGAVALLLADQLPAMDGFIRPIPPVLADTIWMSIHVPVIMVSYSVLALAVLIAHAQLVGHAVAPANRRLAAAIDSLHYWYVLVGSLLLLAGILTGSMWAASSWGRYWGWDPKEVWSLIAFLGYMAILHVRVDHEPVPPWAYAVAAALTIALFAIVIPRLEPITTGKALGLGGALVAMVFFVLARSRLATAVKSILAFWLIVMTYVGVNYVLGIGLHSYGFGTGAVARYMFLLGGLDLAFVAVCSLVYLVRARSANGPTEPAAIPTPA